MATREDDALDWYDAPTHFVRPGKNLYGISVKIADRPGAVAEVTDLLGRSSINVLHLTGSATTDLGYGVVHLYGDGPAGAKERLERDLRKSPVIQDFRIEEGRRATKASLSEAPYPRGATRGGSAPSY